MTLARSRTFGDAISPSFVVVRSFVREMVDKEDGLASCLPAQATA
jgi:hypothetical protein